MYRVMEHEYLEKGLTETALTTLWVVLNKNFLQCTYYTHHMNIIENFFLLLMQLLLNHTRPHVIRYTNHYFQ